MSTLTFETIPDLDLAEPHYLVEPLYGLAGLMRSIDRPVDAKELEKAAAALPVVEMAYARLTHFQELRLDPPRRMTRKEWNDVAQRIREARQGVDWLHSHQFLLNEDSLLVRGVVALLRAAGRGRQPLRLVRGAGEVLDRINSHCAAITLAEEDPFDAGSWEWEDGPAEPVVGIARAAVTRLAQASRIRGYDDADEQARIGLVEQARDLALQAAA